MFAKNYDKVFKLRSLKLNMFNFSSVLLVVLALSLVLNLVVNAHPRFTLSGENCREELRPHNSYMGKISLTDYFYRPRVFHQGELLDTEADTVYGVTLGSEYVIEIGKDGAKSMMDIIPGDYNTGDLDVTYTEGQIGQIGCKRHRIYKRLESC